MDRTHQTMNQLHKMILDKKISIPELLQERLDYVREAEPFLHAFISLANPEQALDTAKKIQKKVECGKNDTRLAGIPYGLKDNIATSHLRTTCGSRMLANYQSPYSAAAAELLEDAGGLLLGKLNMDEFAMGSTTETSYFGATKNPWDLSRTPGGSSGGAAAAVASGMVHFALGSDTGGSIRLPSAYCGITGLKPTYGRVSRYGLTAFASSFDQIGPMASSAEDCALIFNILTGADKRDMTSLPHHEDTYMSTDFAIGDYKLGYLSDPDLYGVSDSISACYQQTIGIFENLQCETVSAHLPLSHLYTPVYYILSSAEASANLARYDGVRYGYRSAGENTVNSMITASRSLAFGEEVKRRILLGTFVLSEEQYHVYYERTETIRKKIKQEFKQLFQQIDLLLLPVSTATAPKLGTVLAKPVKMMQEVYYTAAANLIGAPAIAFPCGFDADGLPVGLQLMAAPGRDELLLDFVHQFQQVTDDHRKMAEVRKQ